MDDDDDDEELLLLRIKALKSTPRVNISVEFTSDSDNDLSIVKKKKQCERKTRSFDDTKCIQQASSPHNDNEDEEERKLREIALSSLRRPASRPSKKVIVESKQENQSTTIHISQDVTAVVTDPGPCQEVLITSSLLPESKLQESSAIQHDLISSTSGDNNGAQPTPDLVTPKSGDEPAVTKSSQSPTDNLSNEQSEITCNGTSDELLQTDVLKCENPSESKDLFAPESDVREKVSTPNGGVVQNESSHKEELTSITKEDEQGTIKSSHEEFVEKMYPPLTSLPAEFGNYSPSSPSEADIDTNYEAEAEVDTIDQNGTCDDVLSLCTSDKDANELDGMSPRNELQVDSKVTCSNANLQNESLICEQNEGSCEPCNEKSDSDNEINSSCPDEDPVNSNASGLNIILDRYLNEVAANKKNKKLNVFTEDEYLYSSDELGIVNSYKHLSGTGSTGQEIGDCRPGPSGYVKPTIIHGYGSESDESLVDTTPTGKANEKGLLTAVKSKVDGEEKCNSSNTDIKCALEEKNIHEDEDEHVKDATCSVCLGPFENRAFLNLCFHSFCYMCIFQWSELSRLCPLCKTKYTSLIHSVNTDLDYETYELPDDIPILDRDDGIPHRREFSETMDDGRRFRYKSTVVDHEEWATRTIERERMEQEYMRSRQQRRMKRRIKWSATKDMRKSVYQKRLQVKEVKQRGNPKCRDISPEFFAENPALKHRLVPWLLRDLNVLLGNEDENIRFVMSLILNLISKLSMREDPFKEQLRPFLFDETDHFVAELVSFASSPYDIRGYDSNVKYCKAENDVEIISVSTPAIQISDGETSGEKKEVNLLEEVFLANQEGQGLLGDNGIEDISLEASTKGDASPIPPLRTNGFENISPVDSDGEIKEEATANAASGNNVVATKDDEEETKTEELSESEDSHSEGPKRRKKDGKKEKKKRRKRKRKRSDMGKGYKKRKSSKKEGVKKSGKKADTLPDEDCGAAFLLKDAKELICDENDDAGKNGIEIKGENTKADAPSSQMNLDKKDSIEKEKRKRKREEQRRKRKHKKKYKHIKHVKRKRRRIRSSSSEDDDDMDFKVPNKSKKNGETASSKKTDTEESDFPLQKRSHHKRGATSEKEEKSSKKSLKRKGTSSGTERLSKRKKKEKNKNNPDTKLKRRKKDRKKKKKKHKHRKNGVIKGHIPVPMETGINTGDAEVDKELRSKIDHAINAIMVTKGGTNSSDDEDEFLNSQEVQDLLTKYKYNDKLDLIKDGDAYKTRAEVVHELLLIEKAITRRKEKKQKQKHKTDNSKTIPLNGEAAASHPDGLGKKSDNSDLMADKATKKAEREKSYKVLIQELQEIEGRINSCRSSLQAKPTTGMI